METAEIVILLIILVAATIFGLLKRLMINKSSCFFGILTLIGILAILNIILNR